MLHHEPSGLGKRGSGNDGVKCNGDGNDEDLGDVAKVKSLFKGHKVRRR